MNDDQHHALSHFLGQWQMVPGSAVFEQGEPPSSASQTLRLEGHDLVIDMSWVDAEGQRHEQRFVTSPDGMARPLPGAQGLVDAIATDIDENGELATTGYLEGAPVMIARRSLSDSGEQMTVSQTVVMPDETRLTNWSTYRRATPSLHSH